MNKLEFPPSRKESKMKEESGFKLMKEIRTVIG